MDLGIRGRFAIVCASSRGLGRACARELALAGCTVVLNGRDEPTLNQTAADIRAETKATVIPIVADVATPEGQRALMAAVPHVDILVTNNGGPPFRDFRQMNREALLAGVVGNMVAPIELVQQVIDGMVERRFGRIVNITSGSVKMPLPGLDVSSGARAGLTGFLAGVARSVAHANVTINFLLPGSFATDRLRSSMETAAQKTGTDVAAVMATPMPMNRRAVPEPWSGAHGTTCGTIRARCRTRRIDGRVCRSRRATSSRRSTG